jgi:hypothetical protein
MNVVTLFDKGSIKINSTSDGNLGSVPVGGGACSAAGQPQPTIRLMLKFLSAGIKQSCREAKRSSATDVKPKICDTVPPLPHTPSHFDA